MYILGDLISFSNEENRIPLPWWHRAPLALETGTQVFVCLTQAQSDRPGDILVSVLDPNKWENTHRIRCTDVDKPGAIAKAFKTVSDCHWNIALAETVTIDGGKSHALDIFCEPPGEQNNLDITALSKSLKKQKFKVEKTNCLGKPNIKFVWEDVARVEKGWVVFDKKRKSLWKDKIQEQLINLKKENEYEINKLVISADTEKRILRCVIPRKGARTVTIEHADKVGALCQLSNALKDAELNVLSSVLKRGGVAFNNAVLVATCEPTSPVTDEKVKNIDKKINKELNKIGSDIRVHPTIKHGKTSNGVVYPNIKESLVIKIPRILEVIVKDEEEKLLKEGKSLKHTIFLSQRFLGGHVQKHAEEVKRVLNDSNCSIIQGDFNVDEQQTTFTKVMGSMWASKAAIILIGSPDNSQDAAFSLNLAHEFGFFQGQNKPVLLLVENELPSIEGFDKFTNVKGIITERFTRDDSHNRESSDSIDYKVKQWLSRNFPKLFNN